MPPRFCPQCGAKAAPSTKFCVDCGTNLRSGSPGQPQASGWQVTAIGSVVLTAFLLCGLTIWATILTPAPPRPAPGGGGKGAGATAAAGTSAMPPDHPKLELPEEAKQLLVDIARKAKDSPQDADAWVRAGQAHFRAAQLDPRYGKEALEFFAHALELSPKNPDALRGKADLLYDQERYADAIGAYDAYLAVRPDDLAARTDLGTMHFYNGDTARAKAIYHDVLERSPSFVQAHVNLGITLHHEGDDKAALGEFETARSLAGDDQLRKQIDGMITSVGGTPPAGATAAAKDAAPAAGRTPFQAAVEQALRAHQIVGGKIVRFEWSAPAAGRMVVRDFPMDAMPAFARDKFASRVQETLRDAAQANAITDPPRLEIADAASGTVMATLSP